MDNQSIQHSRWNCTYHIVFIPKYRRKIMYGQLRKDVGGILRKLCEMKQVTLIEGKSVLMLFDRHPEYRTKKADRHFWARGYYVTTVGNVNEETIMQYIRDQEENDKMEDNVY